MKIPQRTGKSDVSANMTPMIDVVFLLIIFFLVSSHLARRESRIPLELPNAVSTIDTPMTEDLLTVNVLRGGGWQIRGADVSPRQLASVLQSHADDHGMDAVIRIRTDRAVAYGRVEPILRTAAQAGLWNVSFSVYRENR